MVCLLLSLLCVLLTGPLLPTEAEKTSELQQLERETNEFSLDIYKVLSSTSTNLILSPISLQILLALVLRGARGRTAMEIRTVLHQKGKKGCTYKSLIQGLLNGDVLQLATKIYVEESFNIDYCFKKVSRVCFLSEIEDIDFAGSPERSREEINDWVEENTNNRITNLLPRDSVTSLTKLVLVNAIYFKADWDRQFDVNNTRNQTFYLSPTQEVNITMMSIFGASFPNTYSNILQANIIALPYKDNNFRMVIFLPESIDGLEEMESKITLNEIMNVLSQLRNTSIGVTIPKFTQETTTEFEEPLSRLGMPTAFSDNANFSHITDQSLRIDKVIQKAFIEVNEEGTEAAAATGISIGITSVPPRITCDHPFMYMILKGNITLFIGKFSGPESQSEN